MLDQPLWFFANFGDYEHALSAVMVTLSMLGMGATLTVRDLADTIFAWKGLAVGLVIQLLLVPVWAGLVILILSLLPAGFGDMSATGAIGIATGLALIAAMPGGALSNLITFIGNGNVALSVALTAVTTFFCLFATPIVLGFLMTVQVPGDFEIDKVRIMMDIGLFLIAPLLVGMVVRVYATTAQQERFTTLMVRASLVLLAVIIVGSLGAGRLQFEPYGWLGPVAIFLFCLGNVYLSRATSRAAELARPSGFAVTIEATIKNGLLGLLVLTSMFPSHILAERTERDAELIVAARDGCMFVVLFYSGAAMIVGFVSALRSRKSVATASA